MAAIQRNGVGIPEDVSTVLADVSCAFSPALFSVFLTEGSSFSLLFSVFLLSAPVTFADSGFSETAGVPSASFFPEAVSSVPEAFSGTAFGAEAASELSVASGVMEGAATDISGFSSVSDIAEGVVPGSPAVFGTASEGVSGFPVSSVSDANAVPGSPAVSETASEGVSGFSVLTETAVSEVSASSADKALSVFPGVFPFSVLSDISPDSVPSCWSGLFTSSRLTHPCFPSMVVTPQ